VLKLAWETICQPRFLGEGGDPRRIPSLELLAVDDLVGGELVGRDDLIACRGHNHLADLEALDIGKVA
jgi:hypothetical protein